MKLHRINIKNDEVKFELYNLEEDPEEEEDLYASYPDVAASMKNQLEVWLNSVVHSLNGEDYKKN